MNVGIVKKKKKQENVQAKEVCKEDSLFCSPVCSSFVNGCYLGVLFPEFTLSLSPVFSEAREKLEAVENQ